MAELASCVVWIDPELEERADFTLCMRAGEVPRFSLCERTPLDAEELRDYLVMPETRQAPAEALFDALDELERMDTLEAFERCR